MKKDIVIIGGGIAGLALTIDLTKRGLKVILIEKGFYPRQKVCGEYISMESRRYLEYVCPELLKLKLPHISRFKLTSTGSYIYNSKLDLGGFGVSRYTLEELLYEEAIKSGAAVLLNCKASSVIADQSGTGYQITTSSGIIKGAVVCNASGRKSNFETSPGKSGINYIGVKYHVTIKRNDELIEIHNFPGGYCGISSIEDSKSCICYMVNSKMMNQAGNSVSKLENTILFQNKNLRELFQNAQFLMRNPVTISGINFSIKSAASDNMIYLGDSAGCIAPITGNGMSIALRSSAKLAESLESFTKNSSTDKIKKEYIRFWNSQFSRRIIWSRYIQQLSESPALTNTTIRLMNAIPFIGDKIVSSTHGQPF